jgi:hypothetical protein
VAARTNCSPQTRNSSIDRAGLDYCSSMQCGSELGEVVLFDDSGATLDRRVVGMCDSNSGDHAGESGRPGPDMRPTGHVQRLPGIAVVSAGQAQIGRSQAQIENRIEHAGKPEIQQP